MPIKGRITLSGYEGSELLVARLLVESGADVRYVGTACARTPWSEPDRAWLAAKGIEVQYRASLEQDLAAMREFKPDLAIGTTPVVQAAKEATIPALYFTNLISARPLMGPAGAGSLATVVNAALANKGRFAQMQEFFSGVGEGYTAGIWQDTPEGPSRIPRALQAAGDQADQDEKSRGDDMSPHAHFVRCPQRGSYSRLGTALRRSHRPHAHFPRRELRCWSSITIERVATGAPSTSSLR